MTPPFTTMAHVWKFPKEMEEAAERPRRRGVECRGGLEGRWVCVLVRAAADGKCTNPEEYGSRTILGVMTSST
jgi:hypothetical protein